MSRNTVNYPSPNPRTESEANRQRLLVAAKLRFAERGSAASLEQIARDAAVGIGTLYRHFPTRDHLIEAVYRQETDDLVEAATELSNKKLPAEALQAWLFLFIKFLASKQDMREALDSLIGGSEALYNGTPAKLLPPAMMLVTNANSSGLVKIDMAPLDILRAIAGIASIRPDSDWPQQAQGLVKLLMTGARRVGKAALPR